MMREAGHLRRLTIVVDRARAVAAGRSGARTGRQSRENLAAYVFLLPWLIGLFVFTLGPIVASLYLSFTDYDLLTSPQWIGLENYENMFLDDPRYFAALKVTVTYVFLSVPLQLAFALLVAVLLNRQIRGIGLYRAVYYLPSLLGGSVAIAILWRQVFGRDGLVNTLLSITVGGTYPAWVSSPDTALYTLILLRVWQFGAPMLIFLAGLKQIPTELYEAATLDGAGKINQFFTITLPLLTPIIFFNLVLQLIGAFQAFTPAFIVSGGTGGPVDSTLFYTLYIYQEGFSYFHMGYASAMAWALLLIIALVTGLAFFSTRYWVHYGDDAS